MTVSLAPASTSRVVSTRAPEAAKGRIATLITSRILSAGTLRMLRRTRAIPWIAFLALVAERGLSIPSPRVSLSSPTVGAGAVGAAGAPFRRRSSSRADPAFTRYTPGWNCTSSGRTSSSIRRIESGAFHLAPNAIPKTPSRTPRTTQLRRTSSEPSFAGADVARSRRAGRPVRSRLSQVTTRCHL